MLLKVVYDIWERKHAATFIAFAHLRSCQTIVQDECAAIQNRDSSPSLAVTPTFAWLAWPRFVSTWYACKAD